MEARIEEVSASDLLEGKKMYEKPNELKPCPFCGYDGILLYPLNPWGKDHGDFVMWHAKCGICGATIRRNEKSEVIKDWNRRANDGT